MPTDFEAFRSILVYCVGILALPIMTFFATKFIIFDNIFGSVNVNGNVYAAICAIIVLHIALGLFIYKAYKSDEPAKVPEKLD